MLLIAVDGELGSPNIIQDSVHDVLIQNVFVPSQKVFLKLFLLKITLQVCVLSNSCFQMYIFDVYHTYVIVLFAEKYPLSNGVRGIIACYLKTPSITSSLWNIFLLFFWHISLDE